MQNLHTFIFMDIHKLRDEKSELNIAMKCGELLKGEIWKQAKIHNRKFNEEIRQLVIDGLGARQEKEGAEDETLRQVQEHTKLIHDLQNQLKQIKAEGLSPPKKTNQGSS